MKVCFIVGTLGRGGAERQLVYMLNALKQEGVSAKVLCLTKGEPLEKEIVDSGTEFEWVGRSSSRLLRLFRIIRAVRKYRPDVIQSSHFYTNIYAAVAGLILRVSAIGAVRSDLYSEIESDRIFGRWQLKLPRHLVTNSRIARDRAIELGVPDTSVSVVRNIVEIDSHENRQEPNPERIKVAFVGRLSKEKRPEIFVRLAGTLLQRFPNHQLRFEIAGDGPLRSKLTALRNELGIPDEALEVFGEVSDMEAFYSSTDILVLTSAYEGTPNVLLEAMSFGIPVVAARVGGVPELLSTGGGILVDASEFEELLTVTEELILDPIRREKIGRNGKRWVEDHHSLKDLGGKLLEIYKLILKTR